MQRSAEIEQVMREMIGAVSRGDMATMLARLSREPGTVLIGSAPEEYTRDLGEMEQIMEDSTPQGSNHIRAVLDEVTGYAEGDLGWADSTGRFERDGAGTPTRFTCVFRREQGEWKVVQAHASIPVPNDHMFDAVFTEGTTAAAP